MTNKRAAVSEDALRALAEPRRLAILRLVAGQELAAGEIAAAFAVTRPAISQHLTVLKGAGLVTERRDGTRRLYRTDLGGLAPLRALLDELWSASLTTARRLAEADPDPRPVRPHAPEPDSPPNHPTPTETP